MGGALCLFLSESFCFLDGKEEFLFELLEAFVRGQVQTVEAVDTRCHPRISLRTIMLNPFTSQWNQSNLICLMSAKYYLFPTTVSFFKTSFFPLSLSITYCLTDFHLPITCGSGTYPLPKMGVHYPLWYFCLVVSHEILCKNRSLHSVKLEKHCS